MEVLSAGSPGYLEITVAKPGDFSNYRLSINHPDHLDFYFSSVDFSFKQACPTTLDCELPLPDESCPALVDSVEFDPLARDFLSLRRALLDYASEKYPEWTHHSDADVGVMMLELMAALGDEFNYVKDRFLREGVLDELSQRRSLRMLLRLLDYELHEGRSPTTWLEIDVAAGKADETIAAGTQVWAHRLGEDPIPFEIGEGLADLYALSGAPKTFDLHELWNTLVVYEIDGARPKLDKGATELFFDGQAGLAIWPTNQRPLVLHEDPSDGSVPKRHLVHVTEFEELEDKLNADRPITRIAWSEEEALHPGVGGPVAVDEVGAVGLAVADDPSPGPVLEREVLVVGEGVEQRPPPQPQPVGVVGRVRDARDVLELGLGYRDVELTEPAQAARFGLHERVAKQGDARVRERVERALALDRVLDRAGAADREELLERLARARGHDVGLDRRVGDHHRARLPNFVVDEFEAYLRCGILEHGLAHLACRQCGHSMVVAYSCKNEACAPLA